MENTVDVRMGEVQVGGSPLTLMTGGIGSCVAVCLYCHELRMGGLAHVMLPGGEGQADCRYAAPAIQAMLNQLREAQAKSLVAKIVGGANMFPDVQGRSNKVGERNIQSIREIMTQHGITIASEEVGGSAGRAIVFDLANGIVTVKMTI